DARHRAGAHRALPAVPAARAAAHRLPQLRPLPRPEVPRGGIVGKTWRPVAPSGALFHFFPTTRAIGAPRFSGARLIAQTDGYRCSRHASLHRLRVEVSV